MANVNVKFNGKDFLLSCNDGQEDHLEQLSIELNDKFNKLKNSMGNIGENKLLLITAITVLDEYFETKKNIDIKKKEIESLKNKFKELKSLIYEYKNNKEQEILSLKKDGKLSSICALNIFNMLQKYKINFPRLHVVLWP